MDRSLVDRVADDLAATRAELVGLGLLLAGGVVLTVLVVAGMSGTVGAPPPGDPPSGAAIVPTATSTSTGPGATPSPPTRVVVHVTGAVREPAVVEVAAGARLVDAVGAAGGARSDAALDVLNLAQVVTDGQRVHVPTVDEAAAAEAAAPAVPLDPGTGLPGTGQPGGADDGAGGGSGGAGTGGATARTADGLLDLNLATADDLEELPGVGPVLAERILARRDGEGPFTEVDELRDVSGIGEATFQDLAPLVAVP